jgi:hypothetical protein
MFEIITFVFSSPPFDSLSWDAAKSIMESQRSYANNTISVLALFIVALGLITGLWNFFYQKKEIQNAVKSLSGNLMAESKKVTELLKTEIDMANKKITFLSADISRITGISNVQAGSLERAAPWFARAIKDYSKLGKEYGKPLRDCVNDLVNSLKFLKPDHQFDEAEKEELATVIPSIPDTLKTEKDQIEAKLKSLKIIPE